MLTVVTAGIAAEVAGAAEIAMLARAQRVMAYAGEIAGLTPEATAMISTTVARGVGVGTNLVVDTAVNTGVQAVT